MSLPLKNSWSRRQFIASTLVASAAATFGVAEEPKRFDFACFIKPFGTLPYDRIADIVAEVGWTGVEVAVREKETTIDHERVEEELPKFQETLAKRHLEISILATDVEDASAPLSQRLLKTASKLGIRRYR